MDPQVAEQNLTWRANDWIRKAINWTIVTDWTLRTLHLTNHKVECPRLTRNRVKDFFGLAVGESVVGLDDGLAVGETVVGLDEGLAVGAAVVGLDDGLAVGETVVGLDKGLVVGAAVVGLDEGLALGETVVGLDKGLFEKGLATKPSDLSSEKPVNQPSTKPVRPPFADDSDTADQPTSPPTSLSTCQTPSSMTLKKTAMPQWRRILAWALTRD